MLNISPDTFVQWTNGCWSAVPRQPQDPEANTGPFRHPLAPGGIPLTTEMTPEHAQPASARAPGARGAPRSRAPAGKD